ncbi:hypothetical protein LPJ38_24430 [Bradyrhizobium daqingense]|uniref:hypothetical protein n=1 Tax=Bradyrhizobium daqingense TaxID=993502 RepID=UPI0011A95177|nr:hypothetical protein [Bradyrhizobium daqingense]UFS86801.1 hypothetical protein LPJ38_24430 [Bradyrhizobium daqingense]
MVDFSHVARRTLTESQVYHEQDHQAGKAAVANKGTDADVREGIEQILKNGDDVRSSRRLEPRRHSGRSLICTELAAAP